MSIIPFRIARNLMSDRGAMDQLVENFFSGNDWVPAESTKAFMPELDVIEGEKDFQVKIDLPGLDENDIHLSLNKNVLTIRGEKKSEHEEMGKNFRRTERTYGSFTRSLPFAVEIDDNKVDAKFAKGVLTVTLPKAAAAIRSEKKIQIKSS